MSKLLYFVEQYSGFVNENKELTNLNLYFVLRLTKVNLLINFSPFFSWYFSTFS